MLVNIYDQKRAMKQSCTEYMPTVNVCFNHTGGDKASRSTVDQGKQYKIQYHSLLRVYDKKFAG